MNGLLAHGAALRRFPRVLTWLPLLRVVDLVGNGIRFLPDAIGCMPSLLRLSLANNSLTSLPETIGHLAHLAVLDVDLNRIESLPVSLQHCRSLQRLRMFGNRLRYLPAWLGCLNRLELLLVASNRLEFIEPGAFVTHEPAPETLPSLPARGTLPEWVAQETRALAAGAGDADDAPAEAAAAALAAAQEEAYLEARAAYAPQAASAAPSMARKLRAGDQCGVGTALQHLHLSQNFLVDLPATFALPIAEAVDLSMNQLHSATRLVSNLQGGPPFSTVDLSFNHLLACPSLARAKDLGVLSLAGNRFRDLQSVFDNLRPLSRSLRRLNLSYTPVFHAMDCSAVLGKSVPRGVLKAVSKLVLPALEVLDLSGCGLRTLPPFVRDQARLAKLRLCNNLIDVPAAALVTGAALQVLDLSLNPGADALAASLPATIRHVAVDQSRSMGEGADGPPSAELYGAYLLGAQLVPSCSVGMSETFGRRASQEDSMVLIPNVASEAFPMRELHVRHRVAVDRAGVLLRARPSRLRTHGGSRPWPCLTGMAARRAARTARGSWACCCATTWWACWWSGTARAWRGCRGRWARARTRRRWTLTSCCGACSRTWGRGR